MSDALAIAFLLGAATIFGGVVALATIGSPFGSCHGEAHHMPMPNPEPPAPPSQTRAGASVDLDLANTIDQFVADRRRLDKYIGQ